MNKHSVGLAPLVIVLLLAGAAIIGLGAYFALGNRQTRISAESTVEPTTTGATAISSPDPSHDANIRKSFEEYKKIALLKDGQRAVLYADTSTLAYYSDILHLAKSGNKTDIQRKRFVDQLTILMLRHSFDASRILALQNGADVFALSIDNGLISEGATASLKLGKIVINGNEAFAEILSEQGIEPVQLRFAYEGGRWKIDFSSLLVFADTQFGAVVNGSGLTQEEFILQILEFSTGTKPDGAIWEPLM